VNVIHGKSSTRSFINRSLKEVKKYI